METGTDPVCEYCERAAVNAWLSARFRMKFEGISSEAGAFVILGYAFTYIINNLITVLQADAVCGHAVKPEEILPIQNTKHRQDQSQLKYCMNCGENYGKGRGRPCQKHII